MRYNQIKAARMLGHNNASTLSRWEKGITMPSADNLFRLGQLYHTPVEEFYYEYNAKMRKEIKLKEQQELDLSSKQINGP